VSRRLLLEHQPSGVDLQWTLSGAGGSADLARSRPSAASHPSRSFLLASLFPDVTCLRLGLSRAGIPGRIVVPTDANVRRPLPDDDPDARLHAVDGRI